jgi:Tol biopolymer transport system component
VPNALFAWLALSPDGKLLAFLPSILDAATQTNSVKLALVNLGANTETTPRLVDVDPRAGQHIQFTPDGKAVTYVINESGVDKPMDPAA